MSYYECNYELLLRRPNIFFGSGEKMYNSEMLPFLYNIGCSWMSSQSHLIYVTDRKHHFMHT